MVIGRFAPTPSGFLHPGNLLCAMIAYLSARSQGGQFLLRIEDLDKPRCPASLARQAIEDLTVLGFVWDAPPLYQSERTAFYEDAFQRLREQGLVYPCFCSRASLHAAAAPNRGDRVIVYPGTCRNLTPGQIEEKSLHKRPAWRFHSPERQYTFSDRLQGAQKADLRQDVGDFILRRADGIYAYNLAVVVDDALSGVTEVVRGCDILGSTAAQMSLQEALGFSTPSYGHIPLLTDSRGVRLAKRDQSVSLAALLHHASPQEMLGDLAASCGLLEATRPITLEALIPLFSWDKLSRQDMSLPAALTSFS